MTYHEIITTIEVYQENYEIEVKNKLYMNYNLATTIAIMIGSSLSGKTPPSFEKLYPNINLCSTGNKEIDAEKQAEYIKAQLYDFTLGYNKKYKDDKQ